MIEELEKNVLPRNWETKKLGEVCLKVEQVKRKEKNQDEELLYLDIGGIDNTSNKVVSHKTYKWNDAPSRAQQIVRKGDILFSTVRTYLKNIAQVESEIYNGQIASSGFCVIRANAEMNPRFLFYLSISEKFLRPLNELQTGSSYPAVRDKDVFNQLVPAPPKETQQQIVSKIEELFSELDKGIEELKTAQQQLKLYRQAVLKWAFEGKLTNERVKDGELPEGWKTFKLKDMSENIQYGYTESSSKEAVGPKFLRITDIQDNKVNWEEVPYCRIDDGSKGKYLLKEGDLVFARTGATVGKSYLIKGEIPEAVFASYLIRVRVNQAMNEKYLAYFFYSNEYWSQITEGQVGIGQPNVNGTKLGQLQIVVAPLEEQQQIVQEIESRLSVCDKIEETITDSLKQAEALRQSILKKAFEGKLLPICEGNKNWNLLI
jgi:type I restriction enzyme S subunit